MCPSAFPNASQRPRSRGPGSQLFASGAPFFKFYHSYYSIDAHSDFSVLPPLKPTRSEKLAEAPFNDVRADLILETSDEVHFRIFRDILSLASPVFNDMFIMPSPPSPKPDEVQVVRLSEHSTVLDVALRHIYPVRPPEVADTLLCGSILAEFTRKYQVETLDNFIIGYLTDSIESDPVGVYAIAVTHEYNGIAANAVRSCLNLPFSGLESQYLRCTTMERILELLKYHVACGEAASAVASSNLEWLSSLDKDGIFASQLRNSSQGCQSCSTGERIAQPERTRRFGPQCLWDYLYRSALVLAHHPIAEQITSEDFVLKTNKCYSCASSIRYDMLEVSMALEGEIENAVKRVPLPKAISMPSTSSNAATN